MKISIKDFENESSIPTKFTCDGEDEMPVLSVTDVPKEAKCLALVVDDPDAPSGLFTHCIIYDIPLSKMEIDSSILNEKGVKAGINDFGEKGYRGPCPPPGKPHRYYFTVYALNTEIKEDGLKRREFDKEIKNHIIEKVSYMGTYIRKH
ncbi:hypothetical protein [Thermoplasma volcanium GSS1]|uniref:Uncharacterized protein n=1 Tax=Thermoplasma volcanium (strain ATCC 51530 / DSM 4299 / JCM 9571 / NBRC 15438 / GSS1) TaxID=273116 RepID=Q97BG5_THEVO|nr:YbhB/YbcL family Raf kinase inhibitor-like protein [Thermoplasma volcanium]BAB59632.1 hypothetical protein [Thermoplasma volcanium GSS1]